jgi:TonB family protein
MRPVHWAGVCAALGLAAPAAALAMAKNGGWASSPKAEDRAAVAPSAVAHGIGGRAVVHCHVEDSGALSGCRSIEETPPGEGFGAAALALAPKFRREPPGKSDNRDVNYVVDWFRADKDVEWLRRPTSHDLLAVYPRAGKGRDGWAMLDCVVTVRGALTDCIAESDWPDGAGFGAAAVSLSAQFVMKPALLKGQPTVADARIPINWSGFTGGNFVPGRAMAPASIAWAEAPTRADMAAVYPKKARAERKSGHVTLNCDMTGEGRLVYCDALNSEPAGYGFDGAAKELAKRFRYAARSDADKKAAGHIAVMLPFSFDPSILDEEAPPLGKPTWVAVPNNEQLTTAFGKLKVDGTARVSLNCVVEPAGTLSGCSVLSEQPGGLGLGPAALSLAPDFRVSTWSTEGLPVVGSRITIPLRYEVEAAETAAPAAKSAPK